MVTRLLRHYWNEYESPETRQSQIEDWIDDLEFDPRVVDSAIRQWRRTAQRRPVPADIWRLCQEHVAMPEIGTWSPDAEEQYAKECGFSSALERRDAIRETNRRLVQRPVFANGYAPDPKAIRRGTRAEQDLSRL